MTDSNPSAELPADARHLEAAAGLVAWAEAVRQTGGHAPDYPVTATVSPEAGLDLDVLAGLLAEHHVTPERP